MFSSTSRRTLEALADFFPDATASDGAIDEAPGTNHGIGRTERRKGLVGNSDEIMQVSDDEEASTSTT